MPKFVKTERDENLWEKAKEIVKKQYGKTEEDGDEFWALVTGVYKKAGGHIGKALFFDVSALDIINEPSEEPLEKAHKDLPPGGVWRTIRGRHVYIVDGKVVAGNIPGVTSPRPEENDTEQKALDVLKKYAAKNEDHMGFFLDASGDPEAKEALSKMMKTMEGSTTEKVKKIFERLGGGTEVEEYLPDNPKKIEDFELGEARFDPTKIKIKHGSGLSDKNIAFASDDGSITLTDKYKHEYYYGGKFVNPKLGLDHFTLHELGHIITHAYPNLKRHVFDNPEGALGRVNQKKGRFEGVGDISGYNPEESWAEAYAAYLLDPEWLKKNHPKAYKFVDHVLSRIPNHDKILENARKQYEAWREQANGGKGDTVVKALVIDLEKAAKKTTTKKTTTKKTATKKTTTKKTTTKKTTKKTTIDDLPPGGVWRTIRGHHVYIVDGKVVAGGVPGVTDVGEELKPKKTTKKTATKKASEEKTTKKTATKKTTKKASEEKEAKKTTKKTATKKTATKKTTKKASEEKEAKKTTAKKTAAKKTTVENVSEDVGITKRETKPKTVNKTTAAKKIEAHGFSPETVESTRKYKIGEYAKWFNDLSDEEKKKVMTFDAPTGRYEARTKAHQKILDAFQYLRAVAGMSKKAGKKTDGVEDIRHAAQEGKKVAYDVGEKIGGARKDLATLQQRFEADPTAVDLEDLEERFPEAAQKLVTKKTLLKPLDWETEYKNGVDINVAMTKKLIYDRIAQKPAKDTKADRLLYFNAIQQIQRVLEPVKTFDELREVVRELGSRMRKEDSDHLRFAEYHLQSLKKELEAGPHLFDLPRYGATYNHATGEYGNLEEAEKNWREDMKKKIAKKEKEIEEYKAAQAAPIGLPLGEKFYNFFTDYESRDRTIRTVLSKNLTWEKFFEESGKKGEKKTTDDDGGRKMRPGEERARVPLTEAKRVGGKKVNVKKPEDMVKLFGFRGVEFGNYVDDEDGKHHLVKASEALQDLADILGMDAKDVSLNGRLAMAFGARGKGGALAHYEPVTKVINITKNAGAGTLAHEWGHALDNVLRTQLTGKATIGYVSEGVPTEGDPEVRQAFQDVLDAMFKSNATREVTYNGQSYRIPYQFEHYTKTMPFEQAWEKVHDSLKQKMERDIEWRRRLKESEEKIAKEERKWYDLFENYFHALSYAYEKEGKPHGSIRLPAGETEFLANANTLAGGKQGYWNRKPELFARAFEAYIKDKLEAAGRRNDYLVAGTTHPMTYPQGEERKRINAAFDKLIKALVKTKTIKKALETLDLLEGKRNEQNRLTYRVDWTKTDAPADEIFYIPVNRLQMVFQTEAATDWDKVKENMDKMQAGEPLAPVIIGYDYEIHDGHHRWLAAQALGYTHVPCEVRGTNDILTQAAKERYAALWKSIISSEDEREYYYKAMLQVYNYDTDMAERMTTARFGKSA